MSRNNFGIATAATVASSVKISASAAAAAAATFAHAPTIFQSFFTDYSTESAHRPSRQRSRSSANLSCCCIPNAPLHRMLCSARALHRAVALPSISSRCCCALVHHGAALLLRLQLCCLLSAYLSLCLSLSLSAMSSLWQFRARSFDLAPACLPCPTVPAVCIQISLLSSRSRSSSTSAAAAELSCWLRSIDRRVAAQGNLNYGCRFGEVLPIRGECKLT